MPQLPSRRRRLVTLAVATVGACTAWFVAQDNRPARHLPLAWHTIQRATRVMAAAMSAKPSEPVSLPYTVYVGQLALYGPKPNRLELLSVTLDWRASAPFLLVSGDRYAMIDAVLEGNELHFGLQDLVGRKGRWDVHLRVGTGTLAGTVTPPGDPLLGGYLLVSQTATKHLIPPPPAVPPARRH